MKNIKARIKSNTPVAEGAYEMVLEMPAENIRPGQFLNIKLDGFYLRRPISICDWEDDQVTIIYKTVGRGTEHMSLMKQGEELDILCPLGNGYETDVYESPLLIGGGAGTPPMYGLCRELIRKGARPTVILGFRNEAEAFYEKRFEELGASVIIATEDGSQGVKGFVTDAMRQLPKGAEGYDGIFACGPEAMLKAVDEAAAADIPGQMSFERRMGCGFGACMGCSCRTKYGSKRICVDGPVLERSEIIW